MKKIFFQKIAIAFLMVFIATSCGKDFLELEPRGTELESNFYQTEEELFQGLVATYDVLQWGSTNGAWNMLLGLLNAASDDCYAGGSDASDQPAWVAWDAFTLDPFLGPQEGLWNKYYAGIYRANLLLGKLEEADFLSDAQKKRWIAEAKFLRGYFYFDLVRLFENVPLINEPLGADAFDEVVQSTPVEIYAQIESDLRDAYNEPNLPESVPPNELGRITHYAATALLGKVILYQNNDGRMMEAAGYFEEVINSGFYDLEDNFEDIFKNENEFGLESVWEIQHASNRPGDWGCCFASGPLNNPTEGNYNVQFFGMRDYVGPDYSDGWSFCPVSPDLVDFMQNDPRYEHTIIDGGLLKLAGATYTEGYQNTDYFIKKYAPLQVHEATVGEHALAWSNNQMDIRFADVLLMAAEAIVRGGGSEADARIYVNRVRQRVSLQPFTPGVSGQALLDGIYRERRMELATEGHRFFDLVRTGQAASTLDGFVFGKHERLPIPQREIDITGGRLIQNSGY